MLSAGEGFGFMLLNILLVIQVLISLGLIAVVLLQRSEGGALGMGGGPTGFMTARGAGDLLTRTTWILGAAFFIVALLLTVLAGRERGASSVVDRLKVDAMDPSSLAAPQPAQAPAGQAQPAPFQAPAPASSNPFGAPAPAQTAPAPAPAQP
ncbi:preprotein translocase subunit SecG [Phenylobacterium immobile]|uniref:preprotein translocase subunit SecG n=1 Tax=Phenylobacterium immobile TaxID=21 RepID=UPI000ADECF8A|nr:preprotein translocase subunit SecG [Phenylobacterium immobile]